MQKILSQLGSVIVGLVALIGVLFMTFWLLDPLHTQFEAIEGAERYRAAEMDEAPGKVERLKVMSWNVKFGGGRILFFFDCPGDRVIMEKREVLENLEGLAAAIRQMEPDILMLQEVDTDSKRSASVDQVQWLLDNTHLNYGVYASQWRSNWIPKNGLGHVDSGNAILSRWDFKQATRLALPLISDQPFWVRYFYLKRNILKARQSIPGFGHLWVLNTHLSAFSRDGTRARQVDRVMEEAELLDNVNERFVMGGDFNLIPPGSEKTRDWPDMKCEGEYSGDDYSENLETLLPVYGTYQAAIPLEDYRADNSPYFTFTSDPEGFWNRKLDYLFSNGAIVEGSGLVHQSEERGGVETMPLSDHAPVSVELE